MIVGQNPMAEAELFYTPSVSLLDVQYLCVQPIEKNFLDPSAASPTTSSPVFREIRPTESVSVEISHSELVVSCSSDIQPTVIEPSSPKFVPSIRSGSHTDKGYRNYNEDEHICIDDLSAHLGYLFGCPIPSAFYAVFDGHGGSNAAAAYVKENAVKLFFEDANLPQTSYIDHTFLEKVEDSHRKAFLLADQALAGECSVPASCGTTALTALVLGRHLMVANAGDCRAVLCRKGLALQMSQDHTPSCISECQRVERVGGFFKYGCLNGDLKVTRALGDWYLKFFSGQASPLIAEPEVQHIMLTEDDEFLIVACDGIWDVMSNEEAVHFVRCALRRHDDPQKCARELVNEALRLKTEDNLTAIVVCFTAAVPRRPRLRRFSLSEEARNRLRRSIMEGN
ncbi:Phosphoprotein phosphatase [Bertholletia excelsa]